MSKHRGHRPPTYLIVLGAVVMLAGIVLLGRVVWGAGRDTGGTADVEVASIVSDAAGPRVSSAEPTPPPSPESSGPTTDPSDASSLAVSEPSAAPERNFTPGPVDARVPAAKRAPEADPEGVEFVPKRIRFGAAAGSGSAAVDTVGTAASGSLELPGDPSRLGWWSGGSRAGAPYGSVVLAGHLDSRDQGLGFAARMTGLQTGDQVSVSMADLERRYRVDKIYLLPRTRLAALSALFSDRGDARLVLITCGGNYDRERGAYSDNLVVEATPVG